MILVTGVAGSGKSTTMASLVDHINHTRTKHVVTIEDPIEYLIRDRKSIISQRELGSDTKSFAVALRAALRQDPDIILVGEMRDKETIETAILAAETGHLVISTLHTLDAPETINRIVSVFDPYQQAQVRLQLASILKAVISQRLAKRCDADGILPVCEIMIGTARIRKMISDPELTQNIRTAIEEGHLDSGMQSFDQQLMQLLTEKKITMNEALKLSTHPENFALRAEGIHSMDGNKWSNFDNRSRVPKDITRLTELEISPITQVSGDDKPEKK
jgi:twitching motility protein PilT